MIPAAWRQSLKTSPEGPTKGLPILVSTKLGASPTKQIRLSGLPSSNLVGMLYLRLGIVEEDWLAQLTGILNLLLHSLTLFPPIQHVDEQGAGSIDHTIVPVSPEVHMIWELVSDPHIVTMSDRAEAIHTKYGHLRCEVPKIGRAHV